MSEEVAHANTLDAIEPVPADALVGRLLDERYRIESRLGVGGMGIVYAARHEVLKSRVAIKVLRSDASRDEEAIARLKREAQAASAIGSEHIVDVRDFGQLDDGSTFIVMELVEGRDLYSMVREAPLEWRRARKITLQICDALGAAHERGIVHRDLKLENVLLTTRRGVPDFVKVLDFGIAKVQGGAKITVAGRVMGTPEYMSPEQCAGRGVDHRTDIYSLGVMLYEMVTGSLPFSDPDLAQLVRMQMQAKPEPPSQRRPDLDIPLGLEAVILRCLAKTPDARFASMNEVADALEELESVTELPEIEPDLPRAEPARSSGTVLVHPASASRGRAGLVIGLAALAVLGVAVGFAFMSSDPPRTPAASAETRIAAPETAVVEAPDPEPVAVVSPPATPAPPEAPEVAEAVLQSEPSARVLSSDGALLGNTPFHVRRPLSEPLEVELRADGYEPYRITITDESADELHIVLARHVVVPHRRVPDRAVTPEPTPPPAEPPAATSPPPERRSHQEFLDPWGGEN